MNLYLIIAASLFLTYAIAELVFFNLKQHPPSLSVRCSNFFMFIIETLIRKWTIIPVFAVYELFHRISLFKIEDTLFSIATVYLSIDFIMYVYHRFLHENKLGWALHSVHHSANQYELSLGFRINWLQRMFDDIMFAPLCFIGFSPTTIFFLVVINRFSQFWVHTEMIGPLPILDKILNTPHNHRVHHEKAHGSKSYNYGSNFIIWDRLFGTFTERESTREYGSDLGKLNANPIRIQFSGIVNYFKRKP